MCRYTLPFEPALASRFPDAPDVAVSTPTYSGDRIVVNKFLYSFQEPKRWDVVVFKFPGHASDNYIKRLVGLPDESLMIYQGDIFVGEVDATEVTDFTISPKPPTTILAMRHPVHDTYRDPAILHNHGWPLRWDRDDSSGESSEESAQGWQIAIDATGDHVAQKFSIASGSDESWLRYRHFVPTQETWDEIERGATPDARPKLIDDFYSYNASVQWQEVRELPPRSFYISPLHQGIHWVGDLMVEADLEVGDSQGELVLELVEAGHRFRAVISLNSGETHLEVLPWEGDEPIRLAEGGKTLLKQHKKHLVRFANVDDQLLLWVDEQLVKFDAPARYSADQIFGSRSEIVPRTSDADPGDLAPVGIASRGAALTIDRLRVWRDVYYLATRNSVSSIGRDSGGLFDYPDWPADDLLYNPRLWGVMGVRKREIFDMREDQFFVLGDNSPASQDARLWHATRGDQYGNELSYPGGNYLERKLLIGRAVGVVWPHTWNYVIPGVSDMRLIR